MIEIARPGNKHSRRKILASGAALFATLPISATAQVGKKPESDWPADSLPRDSRDADRIATESDATRLLTVAVMINDKGPFRFVVDTGADQTVLSDDVASYLGLMQSNKVVVQGIIRSLPAQTVSLRELSVGPITRENLMVPLLPRGLLDADGYLGLDVINGYRITLDFADRVLEVSKPKSNFFPQFLTPNQALVPVRGSSGHLRSLGCRVDGVRSTAFVDTGAELTVGNPPLYDALLAEVPSYATNETIPITGITGGTIAGSVVALRRIELDPMHFSQCSIAIADLPIFGLWGLADRPSLLIGMNWLCQFARVSIDYRYKELHFDLAEVAVASRV